MSHRFLANFKFLTLETKAFKDSKSLENGSTNVVVVHK
jgi:hypothetical protein